MKMYTKACAEQYKRGNKGAEKERKREAVEWSEARRVFIVVVIGCDVM